MIGIEWDTSKDTCPRCKGEGVLPGTRKFDGSIEQCPSCKGSGVVANPLACANCGRVHDRAVRCEHVR